MLSRFTNSHRDLRDLWPFFNIYAAFLGIIRARIPDTAPREPRFARYTRIIITHYGGPDSLHAIEEECPEPKRGEVRLKVLAAGVALPDV